MKPFIDFAHSAILHLSADLELLRIDKENPAHHSAIYLYATIFEFLGGCLALSETNRTTGIPLLLRSQYEAVVDLNNLLLDAKYQLNMEFSNLKQVSKLLRQAESNPLLAGLNRKADLIEIEARLQTLKSEGVSTLSIERRCDRVGRLDQYNSLYALFCLDTHNNLAALYERHMDSENDPTTITIFSDPFLPSVRRRLSFSCGFLLQAAEMIHGAFKINAPSLPDLCREYEELRLTTL